MRDAGKDAWLGREAPEDSDLDVAEGEAPPLMLPAATNNQSAQSAAKQLPALQDEPQNPLGFGERWTPGSLKYTQHAWIHWVLPALAAAASCNGNSNVAGEMLHIEKVCGHTCSLSR